VDDVDNVVDVVGDAVRDVVADAVIGAAVCLLGGFSAARRAIAAVGVSGGDGDSGATAQAVGGGHGLASGCRARRSASLRFW